MEPSEPNRGFGEDPWPTAKLPPHCQWPTPAFSAAIVAAFQPAVNWEIAGGDLRPDRSLRKIVCCGSVPGFAVPAPGVLRFRRSRGWFSVGREWRRSFGGRGRTPEV